MCCTLIEEHTDEPVQHGSQSPLAGTTVSSLHRLKDINNDGLSRNGVLCFAVANSTIDGGFFVFGDLCVKKEGRYRLLFTLFELRK